jgi:hypothetical protein
MGSLNFSVENGFGDKMKTGWTVFVLLVSGVFALITAILIAWPALAFLASRFFQ